MTASKLWETLGATAPLFALTTDAGNAGTTIATYTDADLLNVATTRGGDLKGAAGVDSATLTAQIKGVPTDTYDTTVRLALTTYGKARVSTLLGASAPADMTGIAARWGGRLNGVKVDDRKDAATLLSTLTAASWAAELGGGTVTKGTGGADLHTWAWVKDYVAAALPGITFFDTINYDGSAPAQWANAYITASTTMGYPAIKAQIEHSGSFLRTNRTGRLHLLSMIQRWVNGRDYVNGVNAMKVPLKRSQCVAPTSWAKDARRAQNTDWTVRLPGGTTQHDRQTLFRAAETATVDGSDVVAADATWSSLSGVSYGDPSNVGQTVGSWVARLSANGYVVPVTIDLGHLLTTGVAADQGAAFGLLNLEAGDAVYLGADWPAAVRGLHYADAINETITPDAWRIALTLYPSAQVVNRNA